jgi:predicted lysophospholipase L1 biosynthesis ABC-type transport system permease subunit
VSVVGSVLVPALDEDAVGGTVVVADRHDLAQAAVTNTLVRLVPGTDRDEALDRIRDVLPAGSITPRSTALVPTEVSNVGRTLGLQRMLSVFLGLIAVVALAHALASTVRDRAGDLFILRAVGFTPRQAGMTIGWMSVTNTVVGLAIGIPCGIFVGSVVWRAVSDAIGIGPDATVPWQGAVIVAVSGLVLTVAVAVVPAWRAAHVRRDALD